MGERVGRWQLERFRLLPTRVVEGGAERVFGGGLIAGKDEQLSLHAMELGDVAALERPLGVREPFCDGIESFADAARAPERLAEQREKRRPHEAGIHRLLDRERVFQQVDTLVDAPRARHRRSLEGSAPFRFLAQTVVSAERGEFVANRQRVSSVAAVQDECPA